MVKNPIHQRFPSWLLPVLITLVTFLIANLLLFGMQRFFAMQENFTLEIVEPGGSSAQTVYDVLQRRQYLLTSGEPAVLKGHVTPTGPVLVFIGEKQEPFLPTVSPGGQFSVTLPAQADDSQRIRLAGPWGSQAQLWWIANPDLEKLQGQSNLERSLVAQLYPDRAELTYQVSLPAREAAASPVLKDLAQGKISAPIFLKWIFYPENDTDGFTGEEFTYLKTPDISLTKGSLNVAIAGYIRSQDYSQELNRLLRMHTGSGPIHLAIQLQGVEIAGVDPWPPDAIEGQQWQWSRAPLHIDLHTTPVVDVSGTPGIQGLGLVQQQLKVLGVLATILIVLFLPLVLFAWWAVLTRRGETNGAPGWPIWLGALFWLFPLGSFALHAAYLPEMGYLAMMSISLALAVAALSIPAETGQTWKSRLAWIAAALLALPVLAFLSELALRTSWGVAAATALVLLGVLRLGLCAFQPTIRLPWQAWGLAWLAALVLTYPVPAATFGFDSFSGWPASLWSSYYLALVLFVLPYVVLAGLLGILGTRQAELKQNPQALQAFGKLMFVFFLVGATRGLNLSLGDLPSVFPVAFLLAWIAGYKLLISGGTARFQRQADFQERVVPLQADLIQRALDAEWARKALNKLMQQEDVDPAEYQKKKKQLEVYQKERLKLDLTPSAGNGGNWADQSGSGQHPGPQEGPSETAPANSARDSGSPGQQDGPEELLFAYGPHTSPWANGLLGASRAFLISIWLLLIYLPVMSERAATQANPFLFFIPLVVELLPLLVRWVLLGFFLGYFFPYIRGNNGWQKGLALALAVAFCTVPHDLLNGAGLANLPAIGLDVAQNALILTVLGLWAFDYGTLRKHGHGWQRLLIVHNLTFLAGYGTSLVAATGSLAVGAVTGRLEPIVKALLDLLVPSLPPL